MSSSTERIQKALEKSFARQRVVFWYDASAEWWTDVDALELDGVEKISVQNDEFGIKHRICRVAPQQKFLLYFRGQPQPVDHENWLLDQLLAHGPVFSPDRASLALLDAGLAPEFKPLAEAHIEFFMSAERIAKLVELLKPEDGEREISLKLMAVICKVEPSVSSVLLSLLAELARDKKEKWASLTKFNLAEAWWKRLEQAFAYRPAESSLLDFTLCLFRAVTPLGTATVDMRQALTFMNRWKDSLEHQESFALLSERAAELMNVSAALNESQNLRPLHGCDVYRLIDLRILAGLRDDLLNGTGSREQVKKLAEDRQQLFWARRLPGLKSAYRALAVAAEILDRLPKLDLTMESFEAGLEKYAQTWWVMDQLYRQFIFHLTESGQMGLLQQLATRIEGLYVNGYMAEVAQRWQEWVDRCDDWNSKSMISQRDFFRQWVGPQLAEKRKVCVIVSDALRFEAGKELLERILCEDRWTAELKPMLGRLPSFTQLGMAALLPQKSLEFALTGQTILADGRTTVGIDARSSILQEAMDGRGAGISAEAFLALNSKTDGRELSRANDVVYVYHNAIDMVGDKRDTEHRTCNAVETAFDDILKLLRKGAAMNISHFVVTADHGFLYQHEPLAESDFLAVTEPAGTLKYDRRFLVAPAIPAHGSWKVFSAGQLGLGGTLAFAFPKGVQRLRLQGSGSRYVHGGTALQEVVIPALLVKKERTSDVAKVRVDLLRSGQLITTSQVTMTFIQTDAVGDKCLPRELKAGFYSQSGILLSDTKLLRFDATAEDARLRERREQFVFSKDADNYNQQEIMLRLDESVSGTTHWTLYEQFSFRLRRAFESDFDEF